MTALEFAAWMIAHLGALNEKFDALFEYLYSPEQEALRALTRAILGPVFEAFLLSGEDLLDKPNQVQHEKTGTPRQISKSGHISTVFSA